MKLVLVVPESLRMSPGKLASQTAHAATLVASHFLASWETCPILVCKVKDHTHLYAVMSEAAREKALVYPFMDSRPTTEDTGGLITACAILWTGKKSKATDNLKLL